MSSGNKESSLYLIETLTGTAVENVIVPAIADHLRKKNININQDELCEQLGRVEKLNKIVDIKKESLTKSNIRKGEGQGCLRQYVNSNHFGKQCGRERYRGALFCSTCLSRKRFICDQTLAVIREHGITVFEATGGKFIDQNEQY